MINRTPEYIAELNREQLLLFISIRKKAFVAISLALVVAWALWDTLPLFYLLPWMGSIILVMSYRQLIIPKKIESVEADSIEGLTAIIWKLTLAACFIWGIGSAFAIGHITHQQEFLLIILLLGMNGAIMGYSTEKKYSVAVQMSLLPVVISLLLQGDITQIQIAVLLVLYIAFMQSSLETQHDRFARSIAVRFENSDLLQKLQHKIDEKEAIERELKIKTADAEKANHAKSLFLSVISHELRTPVHGLLGMLELTNEASMDKESREHLGYARVAANSLKTLVDDLLNLSQAESGLTALKVAPFEIEHCLKEALFPCMVLAKQQQNAISIEFDHVPRTLHSDAGKLRQVIRNLTSNAIKFTEQGSIHLRISARQHDHDKLRQLRISIDDTGIGIAPEDMQTIFEPFVQAENDSRFHGTGLGTSIAKRFVDQMGGDISATSTLGQGSAFTFTIHCPMQGEELNETITDTEAWLFKESVLPAAADSSLFGQNLKMLIAEDDAISRQIACKRLRRAGFEIMEAENGQLAWELAQQHNFDIIMLDLQMPGMDGMEVTRHIRSGDSVNKNCTIIGLSAHATDQVQDEAIAAGMNTFLMKPIEPEHIIHTLQHLICPSDSKAVCNTAS